MSQVHIYAGPTISPAQITAIIPGAAVHPPARHGDLLRLDARPGDIVLLIDGPWGHGAPVRHKEILHLLAAGVTVAGAAGTGALRAAELCSFGMTGIGQIYQTYRDAIMTADADLATGNADADGTPAVTVTDVLAAAWHAARDGAITRGQALALVRAARATHYTRRTWHSLAAAGTAAEALAALRAWQHTRPGPGPAGARDARQALHAIAAGTLPPAAATPWATSRWDNIYLRQWLARSATCHGAPFNRVLQHQQIYDPRFPARWRRHVLAWISGTRGHAAEQDALDTAEQAGIAIRHMGQNQLRHWLTPAELAALDHREQLTRILVRAATADPAGLIHPATPAQAAALLSPALDSATAAAQAARCNTAIAATGPGRAPGCLRTRLIRHHLARAWGSGPARPGLDAAARDRGFSSASTAITAARYYYLWAEGAAAGLTR